jgi:hypothetical protein
MTRIRITVLALVLLCASAAASAQTGKGYLPLEVGNRWAYTSTVVGPDIKEVVEGPGARNGDVYVIRYVVSDHSPDLENDWTTNLDGDVFLHGFRRPTNGAEYYYDPPLKWVDAPLVAGKSWVSETDISLTPGGPSLGRLSVRYTVSDPKPIEVGGVNIEAHGVLEEEVSKAGSDVGVLWTTDGLPLGGKTEVIVPHWWAPGVGELQYRSLGIFRLTDYYFGAVANETSTWSDLKNLYR